MVKLHWFSPTFWKAFDTVWYKTLITKHFPLGFSKTDFLRWLTSYLSDRSHFVKDDHMPD